MAIHCHTALRAPGQGNTVSRRKLLSTLPAFAILPAAAAIPALAATETPILAMFREWVPMTAWLNGPVSQEASEDEFERINDARIALEDRMMAEPAQGPVDVLVKMLAWTHYGEDQLLTKEHQPQLWTEARAMIGGAA